MSIRQNIQKVLGFAPSRAASKQATNIFAPAPAKQFWEWINICHLLWLTDQLLTLWGREGVTWVSRILDLNWNKSSNIYSIPPLSEIFLFIPGASRGQLVSLFTTWQSCRPCFPEKDRRFYISLSRLDTENDRFSWGSSNSLETLFRIFIRWHNLHSNESPFTSFLVLLRVSYFLPCSFIFPVSQAYYIFLSYFFLSLTSVLNDKLQRFAVELDTGSVFTSTLSLLDAWETNNPMSASVWFSFIRHSKF